MIMTDPQAARPRLVPILANPFSGSGPNRRRVEALVEALAAHGLEAELVWERDRRAALLADPVLAERCRCVVAAGGDGSVADVINEMSPGGVTPGVPFATLPMGNENLFARQYGFDGGVQRIARAIEQGRAVAADVGMVEQAGERRLFTLMASAGFDAEVVHRVDRWRKAGSGLKRVNRLSYGPKIVGALAGYRYPPVTLEAGGQVVSGAHAFVFNMPQYGGGLGIARQADATDGLLDWVVFERPGLLNLAGYGLSVMLGRHLRRGDVRHGRATEVRLTAQQPVPMQVDGDPVGFTPVTVVVRRQAVRVIVV